MLYDVLRDAAERWPEQPAIEMARDSMTYAALDRESDRIAAALVAHGCERGDRVAILCQKSLESYAAVFGVLKAGCAYVPLDRRAPISRLAYIVEDCAVKAVVITAATARAAGDLAAAARSLRFAVSSSATREKFSALPLIGREELSAIEPRRPRETDVVDDDLAYVLYTSGSTGSPKGVMISHLNSMSFVRWASEYAGIENGERVSGHAPLHFDLSIFDIFATVRKGGVLVPVPDGVSTFPSRLSDWIRANRINVWYSVPSALTMMARQQTFAAARFPDLRLVIFAGEVFPAKFLRAWVRKLPGVKFMNWYGPTETNVITAHTVRAGESLERPVPIGEPCENTDVFLVDEAGGRIDQVGAEGELCARGPSVALGYWGDESGTARAFEIDPVLEERVYRTGDIVALNGDGEYEYVGRRDHRIKSRGYRIELGEVEAALYSLDEIQEAVVVAVPDEVIGSRLIAFVSPTKPTDSGDRPESIMAGLAKRLPAYMLPADTVVLDELPKTSTGKIDRQDLLRTLTEPKPESPND